jgi:OmpA-OmpF porin, OOP family
MRRRAKRSRRLQAPAFSARGVLSCVLLGLAFGTPSEAKAECSNPLVNACINSDTHWPNAGPIRFFGVASTETVGQSQVSFGLVSSYLSRPVLLRVASPGPGGSDQFVVDDQITGTFLFAYGVTDRLQLDLALPVTFAQNGAGTSPLTGGAPLRDTAVRDLRFGMAYALVPRARIDPSKAALEGGVGKAWSLAARFIVTAPTGDQDAFAGERSAVFVPDLAADYRVSRLFFGADVGMRIRPVTEFAGARVGTQVTTALGGGVDVLDEERLSVFLEGRAFWNLPEQHDTFQSAFATTSIPNGRRITPAEWTLGVRSAPIFGGDIAFMAGGGGPIPIGDAAITVPRFRFLLGIVYAPVERDTDRDGVPDKIDRCPAQAGPPGGERPGCPEEQTTTP